MTATRTRTHTYTRTHTIDMVWVDIEGSGLHQDGPVVPFELGVILTDREGYEIDAFQSLVIPPSLQMWIDTLSEPVRKMHTENGLIAELRALGETHIHGEAYKKYCVNAVEDKLFEWLESHGLTDTIEARLPLVGSTVNYDRAILMEYFRQFNNWLHYRNIDISTLKMLCKQLNPAVYAKLPEIPGGKKEHRVLADIRASIAEYQFYKENFLFVE